MFYYPGFPQIIQGSESYRHLDRPMSNQIPNRVNQHIPHAFTSDSPFSLIKAQLKNKIIISYDFGRFVQRSCRERINFYNKVSFCIPKMNELNREFLKLLLISSNYKLKKSGTQFALYFFGQIDQIINSHTFYILENRKDFRCPISRVSLK